MEKKKADNKTTIGTVVLAIFIAFALIMLIGMFSGTDTKPISETKPSETLTSEQGTYESAFKQGCVKGGGTTSECQCVYNKMKARWTFEEIKSVSKEYANTNKIPEALTTMIVECQEV